MKEFLLPIIVVFTLVVFGGFLGYQFAVPHITPYFENRVRGAIINDTGIDIIVADTPREREQGLSGYTSLKKDTGLLMIFEEADYHGIWMKEMYFPIDVIWIGDDMKVIDITESLKPETFPAVFEPKTPARMVLEVNAAFAASNGIQVGDTVRLNSDYIPEDLKNK